MSQKPVSQVLPQSDEELAQQQSQTQDKQRALQEGTPYVPTWGTKPNYPNWPTSRPGPQATPPPPGMKATNPVRPEQVAEIGYNQEEGIPGTDNPLRANPEPGMKGDTSFDQQETAQDVVRKRRKERL